MPYRSTVASLALAAAACSTHAESPGFSESAAPLLDDGNGAWILAKRSQTRCFFTRGDACVDSIQRATTMLDTPTFGTMDEEWSGPFPRRINLSDGSPGNGAHPDDLSLGDLVGQQNGDRVSVSWSGVVEVPAGAAPNVHSFVVGSDDGFRLRVFDGGATREAQVPGGRGFDFGVPESGRRRALPVTFPAEGGRFPFELVWFEATGGAGVELLWKAGAFDDYDGVNWSPVPVSALASPDLRVSLTAERTAGGTGDLAAGDTVRWTAVVRNAGKFPVYPQSGASLPGGVAREGITFSVCLENNLSWVGFASVPTGASTETTTNECRNRRAYVFLPGPLAAGESRTITYDTRVSGFGILRICEQGWVVASTTDHADIGRNRVQVLTDDPTSSGSDDTGNARRTWSSAAGSDDDETCVRIGEPLPPFTFDVPANGETVTSNRPTSSGTARAGARVVVRATHASGVTASCETTTAGDGRWSCRFARPIVDGAWTFVAVIVDASGNEGNSLEKSVTVTTPPPVAPVLDALPSPTSDPFPRVSGTAGAFESVTVVDDQGRVLCTVDAGEDGRFSCASVEVFVEGAHSVVASATDVNGRTGPASQPAHFVVDLSGPPPPRFTLPAALTNERRPVFSGVAEPGARVVVQQGVTALCEAFADPVGVFTCTSNVAIPDGPVSVTALAIDTLGNPGTRGTHDFTIDATAPLPPRLDAMPPVVTDPQPRFAGEAEAGTIVTVRRLAGDGTLADPLCSTTSDAQGRFTCRPEQALAQGEWVVEADATDAAANVSARCLPGPPCTNRVRFVVDDGPPAPPVFDSLPSVVSRFASLSGAAERGGTVIVTREDGAHVCTAIAFDGRFSCDFTPFPDGDFTLLGRVTDLLGVESEPRTVSVSVDGTAPNAPTLEPLPERTNQALPVFSGRAESRARVLVRRGSELVCESVSSVLGSFRCVPAALLVDGAYVVVAVAVDAAGNTSAASAAITFTLDATPPPAPVLVELGSPTPLARPVFSGTAEPAAALRVFSGTTTTCETTVATNGTFSCSPAADLADVEHVFAATATDAFGNESPPSATLRLTVDAVGPGAPVITQPAGPTRDRRPRISGTAEPGVTVDTSSNDEVFCRAESSRAGDWSCRPEQDLGDGTYVVSARARDVLGRTSPESAAVTVIVDTTPPPGPSITAPADGARLSVLVEVTGRASEAAFVEVWIDGRNVGQAPVEAGAFRWVPDQSFDGVTPARHEVFVVAIDAVENRGGPSSTHRFEVLGWPVIGGGGCGCGVASPDGLVGIALFLLGFRRRRAFAAASSRPVESHAGDEASTPATR